MEKWLIYRLWCQWARSSLPTPTLDLSIMRTLYCSYTLARFSAHQFSACFSLNRFRLHSPKIKVKTWIIKLLIMKYCIIIWFVSPDAKLQNKASPFSRYIKYANDQDPKQRKTLLLILYSNVFLSSTKLVFAFTITVGGWAKKINHVCSKSDIMNNCLEIIIVKASTTWLSFFIKSVSYFRVLIT